MTSPSAPITATSPTADRRGEHLADPARRGTLQWALGLSMGSLLSACGGGGGADAAKGTADTLPEPDVLSSSQGLLDFELTLQYGAQSLKIAPEQPPVYPGEAATVATALRTYNGRYMAPTLRIAIGDTLRIRIHNKLPANPKQSIVAYLNHQNSTNLHFHGLHVDPREFRPGVFGDYVVDTAEGGVLPGQSRQHELKIPADHVNGIYWYHPHLHGSSNGQVSSGMFGAIVISDPNDRFILPSDGIRERVMHVHKVNLNEVGRTDSFKDTVATPTSGFLINGAYQPTIVMRPGEVQNWHMVNTASFYPFNPALDGHTLLAYARDGNVFPGRFKPMTKENSQQFGDQDWPGNAIFPGNRHSIVVKANDTPGTYYLRAMKAPSSQQDEEIVARIVVEGAPMRTPLPLAANLPRYDDHLPITDAELASHGGKQRNLVLAFLDKDDPKIAAPIPAGDDDWFIPDGDPITGFLVNKVFASGEASATGRLSPFQSSLTATQTVALNAVEEWTISSLNDYPHPFHIHVNDSYVVKVNGQPITPYWADTIPVPVLGSVTFRMRFVDFVGKYVWHCHALDHEDLGMMQLVEVVA